MKRLFLLLGIVILSSVLYAGDTSEFEDWAPGDELATVVDQIIEKQEHLSAEDQLRLEDYHSLVDNICSSIATLNLFNEQGETDPKMMNDFVMSLEMIADKYNALRKKSPQVDTIAGASVSFKIITTADTEFGILYQALRSVCPDKNQDNAQTQKLKKFAEDILKDYQSFQ